MGITRKHHVGNYTVVDNGFIRDQRISFKAKGMLLLLLSLPDNWRFTEAWLATQSCDKLASVKSALHELEQSGYLKRSRERIDGKLKDAIYDVYEVPMCDFLTLEKSILENRTLLSTNNKSIYKEELSTNNNKLSVSPKSDIECIVSYLNEKASKNYRATSKKTADLIRARLKEGFSVSDFRKVIDNKVADWKPRPEMERYLRPETLFGAKFEGYLNENRNTEQKAKKGLREG